MGIPLHQIVGRRGVGRFAAKWIRSGRAHLACALGIALIVFPLSAAAAAERAIIVFDASGSMWGQIGGTAKISIARETLAQVLGTVPETVELGFMASATAERAIAPTLS